MSFLAPSTSSLQITGIIGKGAKLDDPQWQRCVSLSCDEFLVSKLEHGPLGNSPHTASIHVLDDDSLLNIFYLYRPAILDADEDDAQRILGGKRWNLERWWYKLAQVCQRWRIILLGSASYLGLCLVCTYGTPVEDMLAQSPPLPLVIDYYQEHRDTTAEEKGIIFALGRRDRVRSVRLGISLPNLPTARLIMSIDKEYPVLEYLIIVGEGRSTALMLPETFQAPRLRHLTLKGFALPIQSRLLTTAVDLITLCLYMDPSSYFQPSTLLQWISLMPQLEILLISSLNNRDFERQPMHTPITTHVTLHNLRWFAFQGGSAYLEAVVSQITTPRLEAFSIEFFEQPTFSIPHLVQFMNTTKNLRFDSARFEFSSNRFGAKFYSREEDKTDVLSICLYDWHFDWQVSSVAQIFNSLRQIFYVVEHLTLEQEVHSHDVVNRSNWIHLLRSFSNVKTLHVEDRLIRELSRCLVYSEEYPLGLLPELQELTYSGSRNADRFTSFIEGRQNAGRPVTLMCHSPSTPSVSSTSSS